MNSQQNSNNHTVSQLQNMRLAGRLGEALQAVTRAMSADPANAELKAEAVRVLILAGQNDTAVRLFQSISDKQRQNNNLEPEAVARMAIQRQQETLEGMPVPSGPSWLVEWLNSGQDPLLNFDLQEMQLRVANGPSAYIFTSACPHCRHQAMIPVQVSLLVVQERLCNACFGRCRFDYQEIRTFIQQHHPDFLNLQDSNTDWDLVDHVRPRLMEKDGAPDVVRNLGQEYHFLLNEILARHLMTAPENEEGTQR